MDEKRNIEIVQNFSIDSITLAEEDYNRDYYYSHPDLAIDKPCPTSCIQDMLDNPLAPTMQDKNYKISNVFNDTIDDNILNYYHTDVFAMLPPNYLPAVLHGHTYFEIVFILSGSCVNYSGNHILEMKSGDVLIMAPNTLHAISAFNDSCRLINIMIRTSTFKDTFFNIFSEHDILYSFFYNVLFHYKTNTYILFHTGSDDFLKTTALQLLEEITHHHPYQQQMKVSYIRLLFSRLLNRHSGSADIWNDGVCDKNHEVTLILSYMQQHSQLSLQELSRFFGYSERQMTRILKSYTGENFRENMQHIRMRQAAQMLEDGEYTIDKITGLLGYSTAYGLRKIFVQEYGMTPSEYRKKYTETIPF